MSLIHSLSKFKQSRGVGFSREAFYSPTHDVIIKVEWRGKREDFDFTDCRFQSESEIDLFEMLREDEKDLFAIIGYFRKDGIPYIISEPCRTFKDMEYDERESFKDRVFKEKRGKFAAIIEKYHIADLSYNNFGITRDGRLVIIDCGIWGG